MFYMFFWFFKQLYYCLRRIFKSGILLLIMFFIAFLFIFVKPAFAFSITDEVQDVYGYYNGFSSSQISSINTFITENKSDYDSFIARAYKTSSTQFITLFFYNFNQMGRVYKTDINNPNQPYFVFQVDGQINISNSVYYRTYLLPDLTFWDDGYFDTLSLSTCSLDGVRDNFCYYSNRNVYTNNSFNTIFFNGGNHSIAGPSISTPSANIIKWNFQTLDISGGSLQNSTSYGNNFFTLKMVYDNTEYFLDIDDYKSVSGTSVNFSIPRSQLLNGAVIRNDYNVTFYLIYYKMVEGGREILTYELDTYTFNLSSTEESEIQQNMSEQLLGDIKNQQQQTTNAINNLNASQQETTNAINDLNNTITDDNIDDSSVYLPQDNTNDITASGLNGIFTSIYNAFCTGNAQDIVFPIPFTNKNITLQANYVRSMLTNNNATWIITIIEAFWWYLISRFIIKDITNKITKIKSGNIEDIEKSNIKGDML